MLEEFFSSGDGLQPVSRTVTFFRAYVGKSPVKVSDGKIQTDKVVLDPLKKRIQLLSQLLAGGHHKPREDRVR